MAFRKRDWERRDYLGLSEGPSQSSRWAPCLDRNKMTESTWRATSGKSCNLQITCYVWRYWWEINTPGRESEDTLLIDTHTNLSKSKYNVIKSRKTNKKHFIRENLLSLHSTLFNRSKIHIITGMQTLNIDLTKNYDIIILREWEEVRSVNVYLWLCINPCDIIYTEFQPMLFSQLHIQ